MEELLIKSIERVVDNFWIGRIIADNQFIPCYVSFRRLVNEDLFCVIRIKCHKVHKLEEFQVPFLCISTTVST